MYESYNDLDFFLSFIKRTKSKVNLCMELAEFFLVELRIFVLTFLVSQLQARANKEI